MMISLDKEFDFFSGKKCLAIWMEGARRVWHGGVGMGGTLARACAGGRCGSSTAAVLALGFF